MMRRSEVRDVVDSYDQDVAQVVHRVGVTRVTIERGDGSYVIYEPTPDPEQHLYEELG